MSKLISIKVKYSTDSGSYYTTHDVKVEFIMLEFPIRKIITDYFRFDIEEDDPEIGFDTMIVRDLMVKLFLMVNFRCKVLSWDDTVVKMKDTEKI